MGNIFRLNPLFEFELEKYPDAFRANQTILDKSYSMEYLFWIFCEESDYLFLKKPDDEFIDYLSNRLQKKPKIFQEFPISKDLNLIEWGNFHSLDTRGLLKLDINQINNSLNLNSKSLQNDFLFKDNNFFSVVIKNSKIDHENLFHFPYLFKPDISFSGIGHRVIKSHLELKKLFLNNESISGVIQSKKNRSFDFSILLEFIKDELILLSLTEMNISKTNIYKGTVIERDFLLKDLPLFQLNSGSPKLDVLLGFNIIDKAISGIKKFLKFYRLNHKGPIAVDGFTYFEDNKMKVALSEMNFRYSMGRILFELANKYVKFNKHILIVESLNDYKYSSTEDIEKLVREKYKSKNTILLTPPFLEGKKLSSMIIYNQE